MLLYSNIKWAYLIKQSEPAWLNANQNENLKDKTSNFKHWNKKNCSLVTLVQRYSDARENNSWNNLFMLYWHRVAYSFTFLCYNREKTNYFPPNTTSVKFYKTKRNTLINLSLKIHKNMVVEIVEVNFKTNFNYNNKDLII